MLRLLLAGVFGVGATLLVVSHGTFVYSPFQVQLPFRSALKVTPDPANIWSWHGTVDAGINDLRVDLDNDGRPDSHDAWRRVMVTDVQIESLGGSPAVWVRDGSIRRWRVDSPSPTNPFAPVSHHFGTPLVIPVGGLPQLEVVGGSCTVHVFGREVTL